jgi:hypothetical protein
MNDIRKQKSGTPARLAAISVQGIAEGPMADQARLLAKVEEILEPHYAQIHDRDARLPSICECQSDPDRAALAEGLRGRANTWATEALRAVLTHPDIIPTEPGRFDDLISRLIMRLAEDAAEFYSTEGYANFPNYRSQIRGALFEDLPKIAEHPRDVNRRRYLGDRAAVPFWGFTEGVMENPSQLSAEVRAAGEAAEMFVSLPDFPRIQVWMQDRVNKLAAAATEESSHFGSKACAQVALSRYNIKAAAFKRLVSTIELQNAFMTLLNYWEHVAWTEFTGIGTPKEIRSGAPSIATGIARRKRWWIRQGYKQLESRREAEQRQKELTNLRPRQCDPQLWRNFSYERASNTSTFRELLIHNVVSCSVPARRTHRDVVEQIARESHIPVESLSDDLNQPVFSRGQAIFGFAGDQFDQIADNYDNMQWWLSDGGLNMAIVSPANPGPSIPTLDELLGRLTGTEGGEDARHAEDSRGDPLPQASSLRRESGVEEIPSQTPSTTRKPVRRNQRYEAIDCELRKIAEARPKGQKEVFDSLDGRVKIPNAEPFASAGGWLAGFRKNPPAARAWLSKTWSKLNLPPFSRGPK